MKSKIFILILILGIYSLAAFFRLYGVNWDQNQHLHPDERFLTMVTTALDWPKNIPQYLDAQTSPLNPHNKGFGFFVYGTFPLIVTKWTAEILNKGNYTDLTIIGRQLSALFDLGTVVLVFLISKIIISKYETRNTKQIQNSNIKNSKHLFRISDFVLRIFPLLAMFFYACMVLPIQLAHFYAVDSFMTFFLTLTFFFLARTISKKTLSPYDAIGLGVAFGLAIASKISAAIFSPVVILGLIFCLPPKKKSASFILYFFTFLLVFYITVRFGQPYLFATNNLLNISLNQKVLDNWTQLKAFDDVTGGFPPAVQWITTKPYIFPLKNLLYWGMGLPLGLLSVVSVAYFTIYFLIRFLRFILHILKHTNDQRLMTKDILIFLTLLYPLALFIYQGGQFVKALRYFYPMYPFLAVLGGLFLFQVFLWIKKKRKIFLFFVICYLLSVVIYPIAFISIYSFLHTREAASIWIFQNIPTGSIISGESWDDYLPVTVTSGLIRERFKNIEFPLYYPDTKEKWIDMDKKLKEADYISMSSNRLYGSITTLPKKWPITFKYYKSLFDGSLGFDLVAQFTSRPNLPIPFIQTCLTPPFSNYSAIAKVIQDCPLKGLSFVDDYADETFTVYDHPKVLLFKKVRPVDYYNFLYNQK